jgi:hypothetical protein
VSILPVWRKFARWPVNQGTILITIVRPSPNPPLKGGLDPELNHCFLHHHFFLNLSVLTTLFFPCHGRLTPTPFLSINR